MKRTCFTFIILAIALTALAQATQPCIVKQYNQRQQKTPLGGVQVVVRGAQTATSAANGTLTLNFATLKPGDRVPFRSATKAGYEIFNKAAVESWNISRDKTPFVIVLVRSDYFTQLKQNLKQTSVTSYKTKYEKAKADLAKQQKEGKLKEAEYRQKLNELEDHYDTQLKNIDTYIDQFARFDLSELSEKEDSIIELVHNGFIDEAVKAYDELNAIGGYESSVETVRTISGQIDQAVAERDRQQEMADSILHLMQRQHVTLTEMTLQLSREEMGDAKKYKKFVKSALDTYEQLYADDPERYRQGLDLLKKEWGRVKDQ